MIHLAILIGIYLLPTLIARGRHLPERGAIAALNILLGWTFLGWIVALIWAITAPAPYPYVYYVQPPPGPPRYY